MTHSDHPPLSPLTERIGGESAEAWDLHARAMGDRRAGRDVIVLSVGDPDFDTPPAIVAAAVAALEGGDTHYTGITGYAALREAIAARHAARLGRAVDPERIAVTAGAQNALFAAALCLCGPGDEVLVPTPMYVTYDGVIGASGAKLVRVPAAAERGFRLRIEDMEAAITPHTRAVFFANPNNPTGVAMTREELADIAELARRHDLWVVADEVYAELVFEGEHVTMESVADVESRLLTISSLSKSHAMTGWRCGWTIAPPAVLPHLANLALCMQYGLPGFIQRGAVEALTGSIGESETMRTGYRARRDRAVAALQGLPGIAVLAPQAGMFCLVDVRGTGLSAGDFATRLYDAQGVSLLDAGAFGSSAAGFLRMSFAASEQELDEGCRRIAAFIAGL